MSNLYVTEPPTNGKVVITTNRGELEIELWSREAPKACRNFVQLCLEGYYIDTIFHRIVKDFIVQGGDPTGTGTGGQSIFDDPFADEFHSRLKYNRRGLVGMANNGKHDNGSQFFFTLVSAPELQGKNTLFGRIVGETIFNLTKIGNSECEEGTERPLYPPRVLKSEVIVNPFPDIVPRTTYAELSKRREEQLRGQGAPPTKAPKKNKNLLSFNDEGMEDEGAPIIFRSKVNKSAFGNTSENVAKTNPRKRKITPPHEQDTTAIEIDRKQSTNNAPRKLAKSASPSPEPTTTEKEPVVDPVQAQIAALTASLKSSRRKTVAESSVDKAPAKEMSYLERQKLEYSKKALVGGRKAKSAARGFSEDDILVKLTQFKSKLSSTSAVPETAPQMDLEEETCTLHAVPGCMSCFDRIGEKNDLADGGTDWLQHTLVFTADKLGKDNKFRERADRELEIIDPREKEGRLALQRREKQRRDKNR